MKRFAWKSLNAVAVLLVALGVLLAVPAALVLHPVGAAVAAAFIAAGVALGVPAGRALGVRFLAKGEGSDEDYYEPIHDRVTAEINDLNPDLIGSRAYWAVHSADAWKQPGA